MACFSCGRGSKLSEFERKAAPVLRKFHEMKKEYTEMANGHSQQFNASKRSAIEHRRRDQIVLARADALEALRHERQCTRLMLYVKQIGNAISKVDAVWASHTMVEGISEIADQLESLSPQPTDDNGEEEEEAISVAKNMHDGFDTLMRKLQRQVSTLDVSDETGITLNDSDVDLQIERWEDPNGYEQPRVVGHPEELSMHEESD
jgi:light-regulated signal transduction histidine kinase (bacteriophytochrome)